MSPVTIIAYFIIVNVLTYLFMHMDKQRARNDKRRISEASLLSMAFIGGSIGMLVSMYVLHHKTRKIKFKLGVPVILMLQVLLVLYLSRQYL